MSTSTSEPTEPKGSEPSSKPKPLCLCGHSKGVHPVSACATCACLHYEADAPKCAHESWEVTSERLDLAAMKWSKSRRCADCGGELDDVLEDEPTFVLGAPNDGGHFWGRNHPSAGLACLRCGLAHKFWSGDPCPKHGEGEPEQKAPPRRPPYAVTYATRSRDFQVLTPGDCSVSVVDGALVIQHIEPVTGVTAVQPYYTKEG